MPLQVNNTLVPLLSSIIVRYQKDLSLDPMRDNLYILQDKQA